MRHHFPGLFLLALASFAKAQPPIGQWREHLPWNTATHVCAAYNRIYCATSNAVLYLDRDDHSLHRLSRVSGLAETGISLLKKNEESGRVIVAYANSNIDLLEKNAVRNISDIKRKTISADKTVYNVFSKGNISYICCGFGIVLINEDRRETASTWYIGAAGSFAPVYALAEDNGFFYAATSEGLKRAPVTGLNLADYRSWQNISGVTGLPAGPLRNIVRYGNTLVALKNDSLFAFRNNNWQLHYTTANTLVSINASGSKLLACEQTATGGLVRVLNEPGSIENTVQQNSLPEAPKQAVLVDNTVWIADFFKGLYNTGSNPFTVYAPNAPGSTAGGEMVFNGTELWAAAGSVNDAWNYTYNPNGLFRFANEQWAVFRQYNIRALDSMLDFITVTPIPHEPGIYAGSFGGGLLEFNNGIVRVYKQNSTLQAATGDPGSFRVSGLATDADGNLWVANYGSPIGLHVKKTDGSWRGFPIPFLLNEQAVAQILVDDYNQKWIVSPKANGLLCYHSGANIDIAADDKWKLYQSGAGNGNLPDNNVYCIAKDRDGVLWVGTGAGIALIGCAGEVFTAGCNAILPVIQQDRFAGYLFQNETVQCIAIDGANRKWVGTRNGAWLISSGGEKVIYRFSEENSPLLSNDVKKIAIHPQTGEVFFATFKGICSFRGTATEPGETHRNVQVFPNPVPPGFGGQIAIRGLADQSVVKITELNGRLVYQTRALGGQAIWNGLNYRGQKISSGAYLVLVTSEGSNEKVAAKIFFIDQ